MLSPSAPLMRSETPLHALFRHAAERPDAIALVADDQIWSYGRLADEVARLGEGLRRAGIVPGDRIVLSVRTSPVYAVFMYAAMLTGTIVVPLKIEFSAPELAQFMERLRPAFYIHEAELQDVVAQLDLGHTRHYLTVDAGPHSWRFLLGQASRTTTALPADIDSAFLLLATSGTTGMPKLVAYNQRVMSHVMGVAEPWAIGPDSCTIGNTPIAHISGTLMMLVSLTLGCKEVLVSHFNADNVLDLIEQHGATTLFVAPFIAMPLVNAQRARPRDVSTLRICGIGGDACRPHIAEAFQSTFDLQLDNAYGLTECLGSATFGKDWQTIGGLPGRARLLDEQGIEVPQGEVGELHLSGPNLSLGYWISPGEISCHTHDGWFATGDLMTQDTNGDYRFVGRNKDLIICDTVNIAPIEVENHLILHEAVADAAVAGIPDEVSGQRVVAVVKLVDTVEAVTGEDIIDWLSGRIASYKVPLRILVSDSIPRNALGKVDRPAVLRMIMSA